MMRKLLLALFVVLFYGAFALAVFWDPIVNGFGSIQWDAVGVHFFNLFFSSEVIQNGQLPLWTPYVFGGFPQISDLQVGIFYPVNLAIALATTFTPQIVLYQLVFHYILAGVFAWALAYYLSRNALFSLGAGLAYAFGGFMVGHASHVGMQNTAAWLPLLLLLLQLTLERRRVIYAVWCGAFLGVAILAGHFQMALYIAFTMALYTFGFIVWTLGQRQFRVAAAKVGLVVTIYIIAGLIAAVQLLPTQELAGQSQRAAISLELSQTESLNPVSLPGLIFPNHQNVIRGEYVGPWDRTQNYLYLSITILVLAAIGVLLGLIRVGSRGLTMLFILLGAISLLYAFGRYGPLQAYFYEYVPLFDKVRAPGNMILIFSISVVALASIGFRKFGELLSKEKMQWALVVGGVATLLIVAELFPAVRRNNLLYARAWPEDMLFASDTVSTMQSEYARLNEINKFAVYRVPELTNDNSSQYHHMYNFDGYNPLETQRHSRYAAAMARHAPLVDLAGIKYLPCTFIPERVARLERLNDFCVNDGYLPQAFFVENYIVAQNADEALQRITEVDIRKTIVLEHDLPEGTNIVPSSAKGTVAIEENRPGYWKLRTTNLETGILFFRQPHYPGWSVRVDGSETHIYEANYLFQAFAIPEGEHTIVLEFAPDTITHGGIITLVGWLLVFGLSGLSLIKKLRSKYAA